MLTPISQPASVPEVSQGSLWAAKVCSVFLWHFNTSRIWNLIFENTFDEKKKRNENQETSSLQALLLASLSMEAEMVVKLSRSCVGL